MYNYYINIYWDSCKYVYFTDCPHRRISDSYNRKATLFTGKTDKMKRIFALLLVVLTLSCPAMVTSCTANQEGGETVSLKNAYDIVLSGNTATSNSEDVIIGEDGLITIKAAGTYKITGTLDNGQIYVDCVDAGKLDLVLNGASISNDDGACIVIRRAQEAVITLYDGSVNSISDGSKYRFENPTDDEPDAAIFSKEDLVINGKGSLIIDANYSGGIFSKDGLRIDSGNIEIDSVNHAIKGKDYLIVNDGTLKLHALGDGMKSTNADNESVGYMEINGGTIDIYSEDEALQAVSGITVNGGTVKIDSANNGIKCTKDINFKGGSVDLTAQDTALYAITINKSESCSVTINGNPYNG